MGSPHKASLIILTVLVMCCKWAEVLYPPEISVHICLQLFRIILLLSPFYGHTDNKASFHQGWFLSGQLAFWVQVELESNHTITRSLWLLPQVAANFFQIFSFPKLNCEHGHVAFPNSRLAGPYLMGIEVMWTGLWIMSPLCSVITNSY